MCSAFCTIRQDACLLFSQVRFSSKLSNRFNPIIYLPLCSENYLDGSPYHAFLLGVLKCQNQKVSLEKNCSHFGPPSAQGALAHPSGLLPWGQNLKEISRNLFGVPNNPGMAPFHSPAVQASWLGKASKKKAQTWAFC